MRILLLSLGILFAGELEVEGNLKVLGNIDAQNNPIKNVGEPVVSNDVATANYVLERTTTKGRIIILKCPWSNWTAWNDHGILTCEPPLCPDGWSELALSNEVTSVSGRSNYSNDKFIIGNSIRYCMEQEDGE